MKRRSSNPLFRAIEPDVYVIDTSAWINIDTRDDSAEVWHMIESLIEQGRVVACAQVLEELRDDPIYLLRLHPYEKALKAGDRGIDDIDYLMLVGQITHDHQALCGARGRKTKADPYVIALAEIDNYIVVGDETCRKRQNRKIPGVCKKRGVRCLSLAEFVVAASATMEPK